MRTIYNMTFRTTFLRTLLLTAVLTLAFASLKPAQAQPLNLSLTSVISEILKAPAPLMDEEVRGFGRRGGGFGMNFGGSGRTAGKSTANTAASKNQTNATNNTQNRTQNATAANTARRSGLLGFLGGMGLMGMMMLGVGVLGGGFLIYMLIMFLLPSILAAFAGRKAASQEGIPTSQYSSQDLFKNRPDLKSQDEDREKDATFRRF